MYWGIPPEVNAFRLTMAGAGPTAHVPQVTAFETAAITHTQQATQMAATAAATAASFVGAGGQSMMQCAAVQSTWVTTAGAFAQKVGGHHRGRHQCVRVGGRSHHPGAHSRC